MKKKLVTLILAGTMAFSVAACGGNSGSESTAEETQAEENVGATETESEMRNLAIQKKSHIRVF